MNRLLHVLATSALLTGVAYGHGGHGATDGTALLHYLIEPVHGLAVLALVALAITAAGRDGVLRRIRK
jgi:hypothetical protein